MSSISKANIKKTYYYLKRNGLVNTYYAAKERMGEKKKEPYVFRPVSSGVLKKQKEEASAYLSANPSAVRYSIVVPAYNTPENYLRELLGSVLGQTYGKLELVIADAGPETENGRTSVKNVLDSYLEAAGAVLENQAACCGDGTAGAASENQTACCGDGAAEVCRVGADTSEVYRVGADSCVKYIKLAENSGISENTNRGILAATGDFIGLLDHDDLITPDALFEINRVLEMTKQEGNRKISFLYSDEDKCNGDATEFFDPNIKPDFDPEYLLSNNYICHFLVMRGDLAKKLLLRKEFDGAQDYDLVLRAYAEGSGEIVHVPSVLYHWRCHTASTSENPHSKEYAYRAGVRALQSFADEKGWKAKAVSLRHLGFQRLVYDEDIFEQRPEIGAMGGVVTEGRKNGIIISGPLECLTEAGIPTTYSGYLHRAVLSNNADSLDIRCFRMRQTEELLQIFREVTGTDYIEIPVKYIRKLEEDPKTPLVAAEGKYDRIFDCRRLPAGIDYDSISRILSDRIRKAGYILLFNPKWIGTCRK